MKLKLIFLLINLVFGLDIKAGLTKTVEKSKDKLTRESGKLIKKVTQEVKSGVDRVKKTLTRKDYINRYRLKNTAKIKEQKKQYYL